MGTRRSLLREYAPALGVLALVLAVWEAAVRGLAIDRWLLPPPSAVARALWEMRRLLPDHIVPTVGEAGLGYVMGLAVGVAAGGAVAHFAWVRRGVYPILVALQTVPPMALAPLLVVWFGYGWTPKVVLVTLVTFYPVAVAAADGLRAADPRYVELLRSMAATRWQVFTTVRVPAALPAVFSGMKVSATYAIIAAIVGEWMGASHGLGVLLTRSARSYLVDRVFATIVVVSLLTIGLFLLVQALERLATPWRAADRRAERLVVAKAGHPERQGWRAADS